MDGKINCLRVPQELIVFDKPTFQTPEMNIGEGGCEDRGLRYYIREW